MSPRCTASFLAIAFCLLVPRLSSAQSSPDFLRDIQPIFSARCHGCHGTKVHLGEFRLDQKSSALKGGGSGVPAILPGRSDQSLLIRYVSGLDSKIVMPPSGPRLTPEQVNLLRLWIDQGAKWPDQETAAAAPATVQDHWSFQPRKPVAPPQVRNKSWVRNPIDAFVLAKLEARGWQPSPPAEPAQLLRRIHLDITGLPPTLAEQDRFARRPQPDVLDAVVDDLLSRPAYGERWARYWLDVVRYAETNGYERDATKPHAWRYRDYVIRSFNDDKPYERFVIEQIRAMSCRT